MSILTKNLLKCKLVYLFIYVNKIAFYKLAVDLDLKTFVIGEAILCFSSQSDLIIIKVTLMDSVVSIFEFSHFLVIFVVVVGTVKAYVH